MRAFFLRAFAKRGTGQGFGEEIGYRRLGEGIFNMRNGVVEPLVQGTQFLAVGFQPEGTSPNALNRIYRVDHLEHVDLTGRASKRESAV